jgi:hypothetical protein
LLDCGPWSLAGHGTTLFFAQLPFLFSTPASLFGHMWSILSHWLQHMPVLPKLPLKFSNTHIF